MNKGAPDIFVAVLLTILILLSLILGLTPLATTSGEGVADFDQESYIPGDEAVFYIRDDTLATTESCTGAWENLTAKVEANTWWSLATGEPQPEAYIGLDEGCSYSRANSTSTPLVWPPELEVRIDGILHLFGDVRTDKGEFLLLFDANASSTVTVLFAFDIADAYPASESRARVTSSADPEGEWVAISEVASEADASPHPTSGLFRGEVRLSTDDAASEPDNGAVQVRHDGDTLTLTYFDAGREAVAEDTADVKSTAPIPATSTPALFLTAALLTLLMAWRLRRRRPPATSAGAG